MSIAMGSFNGVGATGVGNPGNVSFTLSNGSLNIDGVNLDVIIPGLTGTGTGTVAADGTLTISTLNFPAFPIEVAGFPGSAQPIPALPWAGTIDPETGVLTVSGSMMTSVAVPVLAATNCPLGPLALNLTTGTSGTSTGTAYDPATGSASLVDHLFGIPELVFDPANELGCSQGTVDLFNGGLPFPVPSGNAFIGFDVAIDPAPTTSTTEAPTTTSPSTTIAPTTTTQAPATTTTTTAPPTQGGPVQVGLDCTATVQLVPPPAAPLVIDIDGDATTPGRQPQLANFEVQAPGTVTAGTELTLTIPGASTTLPASSTGFSIDHFTNVTTTYKVTGGTIVDGSASASGPPLINGVPGTALAPVYTADAITFGTATEIPGGGTLQSPTITFKVLAGNAGTTIKSFMIGNTLTGHLVIGANMTAATTTCTAPPNRLIAGGPFELSSTDVVEEPPPATTTTQAPATTTTSTTQAPASTTTSTTQAPASTTTTTQAPASTTTTTQAPASTTTTTQAPATTTTTVGTQNVTTTTTTKPATTTTAAAGTQAAVTTTTTAVGSTSAADGALPRTGAGLTLLLGLGLLALGTGLALSKPRTEVESA